MIETNETKVNTARYSDEELEEFRVLIESKIEDSKKGMTVYLDAYNNLYSPPNIIRVKDEIKENVGGM